MGWVNRRVFDIMTEQAQAPKLTQAQRLEKMRAGRDKAGAAVRSARSDVLNNTDQYIDSPEFRAKHRGNKTIQRVFEDQFALREKYKINPDGSVMTIDDEIAARRASGKPLTDRQRKHLGQPTKAEEKEAVELAALEAEIEAEEAEQAEAA